MSSSCVSGCPQGEVYNVVSFLCEVISNNNSNTTNNNNTLNNNTLNNNTINNNTNNNNNTLNNTTNNDTATISPSVSSLTTLSSPIPPYTGLYTLAGLITLFILTKLIVHSQPKFILCLFIMVGLC